MEMGHACRFEEAHAAKVAELSCSLVRQLQAAGKVGKGKNVLELTRYAALLHDVGTCVSYQDHHRHSQYLIRNYSLLGFDDEEIEIIATAALCHRKLSPKKAAPRTISRESQRLVEAIAAVLRIADALDRSQLGLTKEAVLKSESNGKKTTLEVNCPEECPLEMWSVESKKDLFEQVFSTELSVSCVSGAGHDESK
jgi:exopolyphosphatase/guanosine-5'-triphosphate,3'-diphosphate pyrophosphatase